MKTFATILVGLFCLSVDGQMCNLCNLNPAFVGNFKHGVSGPNTWYDVETFANTDSDGVGTVDGLEWTPVVVTQAGLATKARIYMSDNSEGFNIKMGIYLLGDEVVLASGTANVANNICCDNQYLEVTFDTPVSVTATTYLIAWIGDSTFGGIATRYKAGVGTWNAKLLYGYSNFPGTLPGSADFTLSRNYAVSLFVQ